MFFSNSVTQLRYVNGKGALGDHQAIPVCLQYMCLDIECRASSYMPLEMKTSSTPERVPYHGFCLWARINSL